MRMICRGLAAVVSLGFASWSVPAGAGEVYNGRGLSAYAPFWWSDDAGCVRTGISLSAGEDVTHDPPGPPTAGSMAWISVSRYDSCAYEWIFGGMGIATGLEFSGDRGLNRATLRGTIPVCQNYPVEICHDFVIDVVWEGSGPTQHNTWMNSVHVGGTSARSRTSGQSRSATAYGSVSVDGESWTPHPAVEGWSWISASHSIQVLVDY